MEEMMRVNINVEKEKWLQFKKIAKKKQSDASKELRKFIDKYLAKNGKLIDSEKK